MITVRGIFTLASQGQLVAISTSTRTDDRLGLDRLRAAPDDAGQLLGVLDRRGWRPGDVSTVAIRLARAGHRRQPQGGATRRHPCQDGPSSSPMCSAGLIVGLSGFLYAARENAVASDTGVGMEFFALTALVVGLGGFVSGRGSTVAVYDRLRHPLHSEQCAPQRRPSRRFRPVRHGRDPHRHPLRRHEVPEAQASAARFDLRRSGRLHGRRRCRGEGFHARRDRAKARRAPSCLRPARSTARRT